MSEALKDCIFLVIFVENFLVFVEELLGGHGGGIYKMLEENLVSRRRDARLWQGFIFMWSDFAMEWLLTLAITATWLR